ncbi:MAG TPA: ABC transporter permease [Pyrinomonadaceae bacterium]|nr:ABC transporter permease [Pyrinomonadaceae bacterium]
MTLLETLKLALSAISAHKLRSFLTLLGMIIGVTAFMVVLSVLIGFSAYIDEKIAGVGSNAFTIRRFNFEDFKDTDSIAEATRRNKELSYDELVFIKERSKFIAKIGAKALPNSREVKRGTEILRDVRIEGTEPVIAEIEKIDIAEGRYFSNAENDYASRVAFVGSDIANKLFPGGGAVGGEIYIQGIPYRIVGVQVTKGTVFGQPQDNFIQLPIKTYGNDFGGLRGSRGLYFEALAVSDDRFNDAVEEARTLMRIKRGLKFGEKDNFGILTPDAITSLKDSIFGAIGTVILFVPAIALVVGAIVVMNIMLVAVTERTKEIGIRKSVGARQSDILKQFLFESATLAAIGGAIGLGAAYLIGFIITQYVIETRISFLAGLLAIIVSGGIGILAGLYPAWKAAQLDPIEALRVE